MTITDYALATFFLSGSAVMLATVLYMIVDLVKDIIKLIQGKL